jgi:formamidopyrimidine-DNA glycosylase
MPELPEVQTVVDDLNKAGLCARTIHKAAVFWPRSVSPHSVEEFCKLVQGCQIMGVYRRAKYICITLSSGRTLLMHLRMSGRLKLDNGGGGRNAHEQLIFELDNNWQLRFHDTRKFGRIQVVDSARQALAHLGPEPLDPDFTAAAFYAQLTGCHRQLKPLLLDQGFISGLGNIYVDEALYGAQLHPCRISATLSPSEARVLLRSIRTVLRRGIRNSGTSLGNGLANFTSVEGRHGSNSQGLQVFRRTNSPCFRCSTLIERIIVGQRSTHLCPQCQKP